MKIQVAVLNQSISQNKILQMAFPVDEFDLMIISNPGDIHNYLSNNQPSVVILNRSLIEEDGTEIFCRLNARKEEEHILVFALEETFCGKGDNGTKEALFTKSFRFPFDAEQLVKEIRDCVHITRPGLPLPEDPLAEEVFPSNQGFSEKDMTKRFGLLTERFWEERRDRLKTEIMTEVREELKQWTRSGIDPEDG
jgi:response regulator RpfG family c-di-GMP phosphodiesterase